MNQSGPPGSPPIVLNKTEILAHLNEVAEELAARDLICSLVVVGGSYLAPATYPFEEHDPHLVEYVRQIADQS